MYLSPNKVTATPELHGTTLTQTDGKSGPAMPVQPVVVTGGHSLGQLGGPRWATGTGHPFGDTDGLPASGQIVVRGKEGRATVFHLDGTDPLEDSTHLADRLWKDIEALSSQDPTQEESAPDPGSTRTSPASRDADRALPAGADLSAIVSVGLRPGIEGKHWVRSKRKGVPLAPLLQPDQLMELNSARGVAATGRGNCITRNPKTAAVALCVSIMSAACAAGLMARFVFHVGE